MEFWIWTSKTDRFETDFTLATRDVPWDSWYN